MLEEISIDDLQLWSDSKMSHNTLWNKIFRYVELNQNNINTIVEEKLRRICSQIPDEFRWAPARSYKVDREISFDQREGPEYEFVKFLENPSFLWSLAGNASFSIDKNQSLWKDFASKHRIPIWFLSRWIFNKQELADKIFTNDFFQNHKGLNLSHFDPKDLNLLNLFSKTEKFMHWDYLGWSWMRNNEPKYFQDWLTLLNYAQPKRFSLTYSNPGLRGFQTLSKLDCFWQNLESLELKSVLFGDDEAELLYDSAPPTKKLKLLKLDDSPISNGGKAALSSKTFVAMAKKGWFDSLEDLDLGYHTLGIDGIKALADTGALDNLTRIRLVCGMNGDEDLIEFCRKDWKKLKNISITYSRITEKGIQSIENSGTIQNAEFLYLSPLTGKSLSKGLS
ncbi:hypothetical protein [Leptospira sp. GIMC2001]|uniref:hypothetical protein n=1 Tax=Leptospira sp. GIMC2001 TaxID=1513297 RepID=UPI00234B0D90|nr:hypothetical protein [Leptospira sp. GIMC2001]WCL49664.1 hypothetical protein O4O04_02260 [Leptospira sp. GIMC2001]